MLYYEPMQIKTYLHDFFLIFLLFNLISCSSLDSVPEFLPKIHKIDIQQGNEISSEMLMMLKPGMTKSQVRFVLGTPLIQDTFHKERWDYVYTMSVDDNDEEIVVRKRIFDGERVILSASGCFQYKGKWIRYRETIFKIVIDPLKLRKYMLDNGWASVNFTTDDLNKAVKNPELEKVLYLVAKKKI